MGLNDGDNAVVDNYFSYREYNNLKNHWRQSDPLTNLTNEQPGMIVSDSDDERLYHITAAGSNQIAQGAIMPVADGVRLTEPGGADYMDFLLDGTDGFIKWSDGNLILMTDEGTDTNTFVNIKGKGTGYGFLDLYDEGDDDALRLTCTNGVGQIGTSGASAGVLEFQYTTIQNIKCWSAITSGNPYFYIYGYKTAVGVKYMRSYVHTDGDAYINAEQNLLLTAVAGGNVSIPSNFLNLGSASVGIVSDAITATQTWVKLTAEGAAHDTLSTINGGSEGDILFLTNEGATYNISVQAGGNIVLDSSVSYALTANTDNNITLMKMGSNWVEIACHDRK